MPGDRIGFVRVRDVRACRVDTEADHRAPTSAERLRLEGEQQRSLHAGRFGHLAGLGKCLVDPVQARQLPTLVAGEPLGTSLLAQIRAILLQRKSVGVMTDHGRDALGVADRGGETP